MNGTNLYTEMVSRQEERAALAAMQRRTARYADVLRMMQAEGKEGGDVLAYAVGKGYRYLDIGGGIGKKGDRRDG